MMSSLRGEGGISQKMTIDDKGGGGVHQMMTDDGDGMEKMVRDDKNGQQCPINGYKLLQHGYMGVL